MDLRVAQEFPHLLYGALLLQGGFQGGRGLAAIFQEQRDELANVLLENRGVRHRVNGRYLHGAAVIFAPASV